MNCPICNVDLLLAERQGIEIDYCPKCRGVWLDRGELDKIIERSETAQPSRAPAPPQTVDRQPYQTSDPAGYRRDDERDERSRDRDVNDRDGRGYDPRKKKRGGFLSDIFDFGD